MPEISSLKNNKLSSHDVRQDPEPLSSLRTESPLKIVIVGHVDHGKSTLVGRLFYDTGSLPDGKVEDIKAACERRGVRFEWAFLLDALKAERDQGITIDTTHTWFKSKRRDYVLIDAPGHREFIRNMVTGASSADAAVLVVDAREGVQEQTRTHGYLLHLMGVRQVTVAVNKMDMVGWSQERFQQVAAECVDYLWELGLDAEHVAVVPVSSREGDNIVTRSRRTAWYAGPTMIEALDEFLPPVGFLDLPLRFPIQDIYKFDDRRILAGRLESGYLRVGDELTFSPSNKTARVASIESWNSKDPVMAARAGESIGVTLDEQIFVERGDIASLKTNPPVLSNVYRGRLFWLGRNPMTVGGRYKLKLGTAEYMVEVETIERVINVGDLTSASADQVGRNEVAEVVLRSRSLMALDEFATNPRTGRFVLVEDYDIVGGGLVDLEDYADQRPNVTIKSTNITRVAHRVPMEKRWGANGHKSGVLWLTGLSGSGKSTLAFALEQNLHRKGYQVYVLDGDNMRHGLCADLGFSPEDRAENIRRVGEVAGVFARAGMLVLTAFISPYRADRRNVRAIAPEMFHEVYVKASVEVCEQRDPKGLYKKAREGQIKEFTGISAPYEEPLSAELVVDTASQSFEECLACLMNYVEQTFGTTVLRNGSNGNHAVAVAATTETPTD